ncbi:TonB-dependent receptor plug domain-containing protein [Undibacterium fentianense]|uniref:TonB-dependent receptor n=1 Tax=Undibacterium fentianense TaxID=2828728 RepID=A0A941IG75_9BURK|nr:TonB-dependent receptor plug domain-containing protein [Undibacterium fentianense]MBR7799740.1 TonB-dependent receptor [Undibacterium fentianense]
MPVYSRHLLIITLLTSICLCVDTKAQEIQIPAKKNDGSNTQIKTQQVEVKSKSETQLARRDAAAKTVITSEELQRFGDTNINDAMKRVPGVLVVKDQLQLPGMNSNYTQILIDGEPPRGITIADIPLNTIERVEIYRAGSAQFSSQAMAGTINIILKRVPNNRQAQVKLNVAHGFGSNYTVDWLNSDKFERWSYSISATAAKLGGLMAAPFSFTDQLFDAKGQLVQSYQVRQNRQLTGDTLRVNPRIQWKTENGIALTSTSSLNHNTSRFNNDESYQFDIGPVLPSAHIVRKNFSKNQAMSSSLRAVGSIGKNDAIRFDINTGVSRRNANSYGDYLSYTPDTKEDYQRFFQTDTVSNGWNNSGKLTAPSHTEHDIVTGWTVSNSANVNNRHETQVNKQVVSSTHTVQLTDSSIFKSALFVQDEWKFRKESSAYFGLRWESIQIQSEGNIQEKMRHRSSVLSPIIQTLWQLNAENTDRVRLGLSRTYQAPFDFYLISPIFKTINNSISSPNFRGNPSLRPELAWSIDAAYEHNGKDEWNYNIRSKLRSINDLHREDVSFYDNAWWRQFINASHANSFTIEFDTQFPLKRFFDDAPNIDVGFDMNRTWSRVDYLPAPNNILSPNPFNAKLNLDYRAQALPLSLGTNIRYMGRHWQQSSKISREFSGTPVEMDIYGLWKFNKQTQIRTSIDNLFKHPYTYLTEQQNEGAIFRSNFYNPAIRTISLNLEHKF